MAVKRAGYVAFSIDNFNFYQATRVAFQTPAGAPAARLDGSATATRTVDGVSLLFAPHFIQLQFGATRRCVACFSVFAFFAHTSYPVHSSHDRISCGCYQRWLRICYVPHTHKGDGAGRTLFFPAAAHAHGK